MQGQIWNLPLQKNDLMHRRGGFYIRPVKYVSFINYICGQNNIKKLLNRTRKQAGKLI